jgi:hypothetical protein
MSAPSRRVTFKDSDAPKRRLVGFTRLADVKAPSYAPPSSILKTKNRSVTVLHGRVVRQQDEGPKSLVDDNNNQSSHEVLTHAESSRPSTIREIMERKAIFYQLAEETQLFRKMVAKLEAVLRGDGQSTETAWRARVLLNSAKETDRRLWNKLYEFEKTLLSNRTDANYNAFSDINQTELRATQTACMKLHRDFKHSHRALLMCSTLIDKNISTTPRIPASELSSKLGAVGWTEAMVEDKEEVFGRILKPQSHEPTYISFQEGKKRQERFLADDVQHGEYDSVAEDPKHDIRFASVDKELLIEDNQCYERRGYNQCYERRGYMCGAIGFEGFDDKSIQESDNNSWYKYLNDDISYIQQGILRMGTWLDDSATHADYATVSQSKPPSDESWLA